MSQGDVASFVEFAEALDVKFEAGQRAFCLVAFDGVQPRDLEGEDREWARRIFGPIDEVPPDALDAIGIVAGGRSGKTYLCSLRLLHLALTIDLSILAPGEQAFAAIIAPRLPEARQGLRYAAGAARKHPEIARLIVSDTTDQLVLKRDDGELVAIMPLAAGAGGISGRGKTLIGLLMDETCFFRDATSGVVNDQVIYDAAEPRVMEGGQTMVSSTPWVARGLLHMMWKKNNHKPGDHLIAHASTVNMRSNERQLKKVEKAYRKDASNAAIEFGAEWGSTTTELLFTDAELDALFKAGAPELGRRPLLGERVAAGGDLGFSKNSSTLAIVHELLPTKERPDALVVLAHLEEQQPPAGKMLEPSVVCSSFAATAKSHGVAGITADQHERASLTEYATRAGLAVYPAQPAGVALLALRAAIRDDALRAPDHPRLRQQLEALKVKRTRGDQLQVVIPEAIDGSHCDLAVALAQAVWGLGRWGGSTVKPAKVEVDPDENPREAMRQHLMHPPKDSRGWLKRYRG